MAMQAIVKTFLLVAVIISCFLGMVALKFLRLKPAKEAVAKFCCRSCLAIIGVDYSIKGRVSPERPLLLVTNHTSYLDIFLLGAKLPVVFTPKAEIGRWPLIGSICRVVGCVFIDRRIHKTTQNRNELIASLEEGSVVCLFPEGTTNDGKRILPFHSSYFSLAEENFHGAPLTIQPALIRYTHINGVPISSGEMPLIAWYGDMELAPHAAKLLKLGKIRAELEYLPPITIEPTDDRKEVARR